MNKKILKKWISNITTLGLFFLLIVLLFVVISSRVSGGEPQFFGYQLKTVLSGSMEPGIKTGSVIAVKTGGDMTRFKKGDVITYKIDENNLVTHRVENVIKKPKIVMYETKGDNNRSPDINPVLAENVIAEYNGFTISYLGYVISFTNSKNGAFLLLLPGLLLLGYSITMIIRVFKQLDQKNRKPYGKNV